MGATNLIDRNAQNPTWDLPINHFNNSEVGYTSCKVPCHNVRLSGQRYLGIQFPCPAQLETEMAVKMQSPHNPHLSDMWPLN